jgi:hypothetical protein
LRQGVVDKTAKQVEVPNYRRLLVVNAANTWEESIYSYPGRSVRLLPEGEAHPKGAMGGRDAITGFTEVSSESSTARLKSGKAQTSESQGVVLKLEVL